MNVIGVSGYARSGKDTFASIAMDILRQNGIKAKQYSFAGALKEEVKEFLQKNCGVDVYTTDSELKKDIRDFLVWYGTTFWRKRDPKRWIRGVDLQMKTDILSDGIVNEKIDVAIVSDVRYPNEGEWIRAWNGYLVHVSAWTYELDHDLGGNTPKKKFFDAPNEQERINDPLLKEESDIQIEWQSKGLTALGAFSDEEFRMQVQGALNSMTWFTDALTQSLSRLGKK